MGTIRVPTVKRKTRDVAPKLTARAPDLSATFTKAGATLGQAIKGTGEAIEGVAKDVKTRIDTHKADKNRELVNDTYLESIGQMELAYQEIKVRPDVSGDNKIQELNEAWAKANGEAEVRLGGDKEALARFKELSFLDIKRQKRELAINVVTDREAAKATEVSSFHANNIKIMAATPTASTLNAVMAADHAAIDRAGYDPKKAAQLKTIGDQDFVEEYLSALGPEEALATLDNRKLGYGKFFKDTEAKDNFRKLLQTKADSQKKRVEQEKQKQLDKLAADTLNSMVKGEEVDPQVIYNNPAVKNDPKAIAGFQKLFDNYSKTIKKTTQEREYTETMNDPNLVSMTDADIFNKVTDVDDAKKVTDWRDNVLKNPSVNGQEYDEVKKFLKKDFEADKFGGKDTPEAKIEYARQLRSYQEWALANPDAKPVDYYKQVMEPVNISFFDRAVSAAIPFFTDPRLEKGAGPVQRRQEVALDTEATKILKDNNKPVTPANVAAVRAHLEAQSGE